MPPPLRPGLDESDSEEPGADTAVQMGMDGVTTMLEQLETAVAARLDDVLHNNGKTLIGEPVHRHRGGPETHRHQT